MADPHAPAAADSPELATLMTERRAFWSNFTGATKYSVIVIALLVIALYVFFG